MNEFSIEQGSLGRGTEVFDYSLASPSDWTYADAEISRLRHRGGRTPLERS